MKTCLFGLYRLYRFVSFALRDTRLKSVSFVSLPFGVIQVIQARPDTGRHQ